MSSWKTPVIAVMMLLTATFALDLNAQVQMSTDHSNTYALICRKLGRGISNVGFGVLELPIKIMEINFEEGGIPAVTYGPFLGLGYFLARVGVGVTEIITFPIPLPGCALNVNEGGWGYGPIMRPEWIITPETNAFSIFYPSTRTMDI